MPSTATDRLNGVTTNVAVKAPCSAVTLTNITLAGLQGHTANDRVLVTAQTNPVDNGIYDVSSGNWTRSKDFDGNRDVTRGTRVLVAFSASSPAAEYEVTTNNPITIGTTALVFTLRYGANATYDITPAEIAAGVTPTNNAYPENDADRYDAPDNATMYLALLSSLKNGERFDMLRALPKDKWAAIRTYTSTYDCVGWINDVLADMNTAKRGDLYFSDGLFNVEADVIRLPRYVHITGAGRRGFGGPGSTGRGTIIQARRANAFDITEASLVTTDILLQNFAVLGLKATYGAGYGLNFTKVAGVELRDMVVADFGTDNILFGSNAGEYNMYAERVYSAQAGSANIRVNAQYSRLTRVQTDAGQYGAYLAVGADHVLLDGQCHFEGASLYGLTSVAGFTSAHGLFVRATVTGSGGIQIASNHAILLGCEVFGDDDVGAIVCPIGFDIPTGGGNYGAIITNCKSRRFAKGLISHEGYGSIANNTFEANAIGAELVGGSFRGRFSGNTCDAPIPLKHTSGTYKWYLENNTLLTSGVPSLPTIIGLPIAPNLAEADPQVLTGAGAVSLLNKTTHWVTTGANAGTLADGWEGQEKFIVMKTDGGDGTLTPANLYNGTTITFNDVGDSAHVLFTNGQWTFIGGTASLA